MKKISNNEFSTILRNAHQSLTTSYQLACLVCAEAHRTTALCDGNSSGTEWENAISDFTPIPDDMRSLRDSLASLIYDNVLSNEEFIDDNGVFLLRLKQYLNLQMGEEDAERFSSRLRNLGLSANLFNLIETFRVILSNSRDLYSDAELMLRILRNPLLEVQNHAKEFGVNLSEELSSDDDFC